MTLAHEIPDETKENKGFRPELPCGAPKSAAPKAELTCFGEGLDRLACDVGGWPAGSVVHTVMVMNPKLEAPPERKQIEIKGAVPKGADRKGHPVFGKRADDFRAVITLAQYRAAIAKAEGK